MKPDAKPGWKDYILITLVIGGGIIVWYAYQQNKKFKNHLNRMALDMDNLQKAENAYKEVQEKLEQAVEDKNNVEKKLQEETETSNMHNSYSDLEVSQLKAEIEVG